VLEEDVTADPHPPPKRPRRRPAVASRMLALACALVVFALGAPGARADSGTASASAFDRQGMWVWYVSKSHHGRLGQIIGRARQSGVGTVYVKAGDGAGTWSQFTSTLVSHLHAGGLKVCAWQFVYGDAPYKEAQVGAAAVEKGADCLIIDAEGDYEGKYASADQYVRKLRALVGADFPIGLAAFPYVDYHPGFPYSVFLGQDGAQYNLPQMYWKTIGTTVSGVYAHTFPYNRVFQRPIYPIGQTYDAPGEGAILRFRRLALNYGATGVSWWSWQETTGREWGALGTRARRVGGFRPNTELPLLKRKSRGDLVVWAQEHLVAAGQSSLPVTGLFGNQTRDAVIAFQGEKGLPADGMIGTDTWHKLLEYTPVRIPWGARVLRARAAGAASRSALPLSASLPARENEIDPGPRP
jgi:Putative peptidoglycan binding domain